MAKRGRKKKSEVDVVTSTVEAVLASVGGDISSLSTGAAAQPKVFLDTGNYALNWCLSGKPLTGGVAGGMVVEIFGPNATGKSRIIYQIIASAHKRGGYGILDDTENAYSPSFGTGLGIDNNRLFTLGSVTVEEHSLAIQKLVPELRAKIGLELPIVVALDSLATLSTEHELDKGFNAEDMGRKAKQIKKAIRLLVPMLRHDPNLYYIVANHVIANIGVYGSGKITPGGSGFPFQSAVRVELKVDGKLKMSDKEVVLIKTMPKEDDQIIGTRVRAYVRKNKIVSPFRLCFFSMKFRGDWMELDKTTGLQGILLPSGIVERAAKGWVKLKGTDRKFRLSDVATDEELRNLILSILEENGEADITIGGQEDESGDE